NQPYKVITRYIAKNLAIYFLILCIPKYSSIFLFSVSIFCFMAVYCSTYKKNENGKIQDTTHVAR
ncbi:hypothetical protein L9F63_003060, partial [Diploptera punctata]